MFDPDDEDEETKGSKFEDDIDDLYGDDEEENE